MSQYQQDPKALAIVMQRASTDRRFRERLLTEPRDAIRDVFGIVIPASFCIRFIEKTRDIDALVVLPDFVTAADGELSEVDLTTVSGGMEVDYSWSEETPPGFEVE
jgi:hypothetical protein